MKAITLKLLPNEAHAVLRALAVANSVPKEYDAHRDEISVRNWVAQRLFLLVDGTRADGTQEEG